MMLDSFFWKNKRVLITGHTGFKGGWLAMWLTQLLEANVFGYALKGKDYPNLFEVCELEGLVHNMYGDIRNKDLICDYMNQCRPEIVFHLAAQPLVLESYRSPVDTYETNVMGTVNVLEAARKCSSIKAIVVVTTDKCYENKEWLWGYRESDGLGGYDPYATSKACVELIAQSYRRSFFQADKVFLATARAGNVIGGGDWAQDRLIPDCIRALALKNEIVLRNPEAVRPWQFVLEPLRGYLMLAEHLYKGEKDSAAAWNFGPNRDSQISVKSVVSMLCHRMGGRYEIKLDDSLHEARLLELDISKAYKLLQWKPQLNLNQTLDMTIAWYEEWLNRKTNMLKFSIEQIEKYQEVGRNG